MVSSVPLTPFNLFVAACVIVALCFGYVAGQHKRLETIMFVIAVVASLIAWNIGLSIFR